MYLAVILFAFAAVFQTGHTREVTYVDWNPQGTRVLSYSEYDGSMRIWVIPEGKVESVFLAASLTTSSTVSAGHWWARRASTGLYEIGQAGSQVALWRFRSSDRRSAQISRDGAYLVAARESAVRLILRRTGEETALLQGHPGAVFDLAFSADGNLLASANGDGTVAVRDARKGTIASLLPSGARAVAFSPDGSRAASAGHDAIVRVWEARSGLPVWASQAASLAARSQGHTHPVRAVAFSPNGRFVASGGQDATVRVWNAETGSQGLLLQTASPVLKVVFSPDADTLAAGCEDGSILFWELPTGRELGRLPGSAAVTHAIRPVTSDEWQVVSAVRHGQTGLRASSGQFRWTLRGSAAEGVYAIAAPDGSKLIATANVGGVVALWDANTGTIVRQFASSAPILAVALTSDGKLLAAGGEDQTIRVWDTATGALLWDIEAVL